MCFSLLLYSLKWQLSCSWTHNSFIGNIVRSANKKHVLSRCSSIHFFWPTSLKISLLPRWVCS
ncbi:hypothetical protein AB205_0095660 [Aquarana catesbeiana]|uniref:Secreted protein n=1 Tax=Aquarana catesbeiana TaxID=8400 RepID=A0A2G9SLN5_AQUCT|nr:hypothetical protein AB205_0095660 [Aquarana catesbeiana]